MSQPETILLRAILARVSSGRWRWARNTRGHGLHVPAGLIEAAIRVLGQHGIPASRITYGVGPNGAADLLGIETVRIAPEHVGEVWARAAVAEVKTPSGRVRPEQSTFARTATRLGLRTFLWRSVEQAAEETR